jgi:hypothetical protein
MYHRQKKIKIRFCIPKSCALHILSRMGEGGRRSVLYRVCEVPYIITKHASKFDQFGLKIDLCPHQTTRNCFIIRIQQIKVRMEPDPSLNIKKTSLCREGLGGIILPQLVYSKLQGRLTRKQLPGTQRKLKEQHLLNLIFPEALAFNKCKNVVYQNSFKALTQDFKPSDPNPKLLNVQNVTDLSQFWW